MNELIYTYWLIKIIYKDIISPGSDDTANSIFKRILLYLCLCINRYATKEHIRYILHLIDPNITESNIDVFIHRERKGSSINSKIVANANRYAVYSLTTSGLNKLHDLLRSYHSKRQISYSYDHERITNCYLSHRRDSPSDHTLAINTLVLSLLFCCNDLENVPLLEREVRFKKNGLRQENGIKEKDDIIPDVYLSYHLIQEHSVFFEVDRNTERYEGTTGLIEKIRAYSHMSITLTHYQFAPVAVIFSMSNKIDKKNDFESPVFLKGEKLYCMSYTISLLLKALDTEENMTINDMIFWLKVKGKSISGINRSKNHLNILQLLDFIKERAMLDGTLSHNLIKESEQGECLASFLPELIKNIKSDNSLRTMNNPKNNYYQKKKSSLFFKLIEVGHEGIIISPNGDKGSLQQGMILACYPESEFNNHIPYILPEYYFKNVLTSIIRNLGIPLPDNNADPKCLPLQGKQFIDDFGNQHSEFATYMRCSVIINNLTICIENISDDFGGYLRVKEYLKLPPNFRPATLLIVLINDDLILADGNHLNSSSLYMNEELSIHTELKSFINYVNFNIYDLYNYYMKEIDDKSATASLLPFLYTSTQDILFVTYGEFQKAQFQKVTPWLMLPNGSLVNRVHSNIELKPPISQLTNKILPPIYWEE